MTRVCSPGWLQTRREVSPLKDPGPDSDDRHARNSNRRLRVMTAAPPAARHREREPIKAQLPCVAPPLAPHRSEEEDVTVDDAEAVIERSHLAWGEFVKGDPGHALQLFRTGTT